MAFLPLPLTGSASPTAFFGPVSILPRLFFEQSLQQRLLLPPTSETSPSGPYLVAFLESSRVGPSLILCLQERSWLSLALLNQESHEHLAAILALPD